MEQGVDQGVGARIKRLREEREWSMAKLAVEAEMSVSGVSMIENGKRNLTTTTLAKLARAFGVEIADLFPKAEAPLPLDFADSGALIDYLWRVNAQLERLLAGGEDPNRAVEGLAWEALRQAQNAPGWNDLEAPLMRAWTALSASAVKLRDEAISPGVRRPPASGEAEQRLANVPGALGDYIIARAEAHQQELENPESPHFRTATAAALWLSGVNEEARMWSEWVQEHTATLAPPTEGFFDPETWGYAFELTFSLLPFYGVADEAEERIARMNDAPDELARKRLEKATEEARPGRERAEELQRVANG